MPLDIQFGNAIRLLQELHKGRRVTVEVSGTPIELAMGEDYQLGQVIDLGEGERIAVLDLTLPDIVKIATRVGIIF